MRRLLVSSVFIHRLTYLINPINAKPYNFDFGLFQEKKEKKKKKVADEEMEEVVVKAEAVSEEVGLFFSGFYFFDKFLNRE